MESVFRKTGDPAQLRREIETASAAALVANEAGFFRVPQVLDADVGSGWVDFERIEGAVPLSALKTWNDRSEFAFRCAADSLHRIHANLVLPERIRSDRLDSIEARSPEAFMHGDYTIDNVMLETPATRIAIVDWSAAPWLSADANFGPVLWDVAWMAQSICMLHPLSIGAKMRRAATECFVERYLDGGNDSVDAGRIAEYGLAVAELTDRFITDRLRLSRPLMRRGVARFRRFCRRLTTGG